MQKLVLLLILSTTYAVDVYKDIDWTKVSSIEGNSAVPRGCVCKESQSTDQTCKAFDCPCTCDLIAGECDPFCCCDEECSSEQRAEAKNNGLCLPDGVVESTIELCSADISVNEKYRMSKGTFGELLCVTVDNSQTTDGFTGEVSYSTADDAFSKNPVGFSYVKSYDSPSRTHSSNTTYAIQDPVKVTTADNYDGAFGGFLPFPVPSIGSAECFDTNPSLFETTTVKSTCTRIAESLATGCVSKYGMASFVQNLRVATTPDASSASPTKYIDITIGTISEYTESTNSYEDKTDSPPAYLALPVYDTGVCDGILRELEYVVAHNGTGEIISVTANVVIGSHTSLSGPIAIDQTFKITYKGPDASESNATRIELSGNPGYLDGLPLRAGKREENTIESKEAISEHSQGLHIIGSGLCSLDRRSMAPVKFGQDIQTSCSLSMTQAEFDQFCDTTIIPPEILLTATHIAQFGSSDPMTVSDWIEIFGTEPTEKSPTSTTGKCEPVTSLTIEVLVAKVGPISNPQNKIISARAQYKREAWKFKLGTPDTTQNFLLKTSVEYVYTSDDIYYASAPCRTPAYALMLLCFISCWFATDM